MTVDPQSVHEAVDAFAAEANGAIDALETRVADLTGDILAAQERPAATPLAANETLSHLAEEYGVTVDQLKRWNPNLVPTSIPVGTTVWLVDPATVPAPVPAPEPEPPPPVVVTQFGVNNKVDTATTIKQFGSAPAIKLFDGGSGVFPDVVGKVPIAKRGQACFKGNMDDLAAGRRNKELEAYILDQQARGVKLLIITPWQEPNGELNAGTLSLATYHAGCKQVAKVVQAVGIPGVTMLGQTFTADQARNGVNVPDNWWLPPDQVGGTRYARACLDNYGNPAGAKNYGGDPYATPYPTPEQVSADAYLQVERVGYAENYGISEWNYPWRKNLPDADHSKRLAAFAAHVDWWRARPFPPRHMFLWHGNGNQFDQNLYTAAEVDFWARYMASTP